MGISCVNQRFHFEIKKWGRDERYQLKFIFYARITVKKVLSRNGCFKKIKHTKFSEKQTFLTPWYAHVRKKCSRGKKCWFFGNFGVLCFLETPVLRFAFFALLPRNFSITSDEISMILSWFSRSHPFMSLPYIHFIQNLWKIAILSNKKLMSAIDEGSWNVDCIRGFLNNFYYFGAAEISCSTQSA